MRTVAAAIIEKNGKFLIAKRKAGGVVGGKWEFPGGKIEHGESMQEGLKRELKEELDIDADIGDFFDEHVKEYNTGSMKIFAYLAECRENKFKLSEHEEICWVSGMELYRFDFSGNSRPFIEKLSA